MLRHKALVVLGASIALVASLSACSTDTAPSASGDPDELIPVNLTVLPIANVAPVQLAIDQGFFTDQGLDVTVSYATTGPAIVPGVLNGSVDIGYSNLPALILARSQGLPVVTIATSDGPASNADVDTNAVIVRADSGITDAAGLNGKTVAVNALGGLIYMITRAAADNTGGDSSTYQFTEIPFPDMLGALKDGRIDGASITEPFLTLAESSGDFTRIVNTGSLGGAEPGLVFDGYFTSEQTLAAKPEVMSKFRTAIYEANAYASENPDAARTAVGEYTKTPPEVLTEIALPTWPVEAVTTSDYDTIVGLMERYELFDGDVPVPTYDQLVREE